MQLVLINISDHFTRKSAVETRKKDKSTEQTTILGVIYGRQDGLNVDIRTSMELVHTEKDGAVTINQEHLKKSLELSKCCFHEMCRLLTSICFSCCSFPKI